MKKKVLALSLVIAMIALLSFNTLAWFNAKDTITNTFHIATSGDSADPDDIFSVDVWELVDPDQDGDPDDDNDGKIDEDNKDRDGLQFPNIVPGGTYSKNPYVENTGAYNQWIRVGVSVSEANAWQNIMEKHKLTDLSAIFKGHDESVWTRAEKTYYDPAADTLTYYYYLNNILKPGETVPVFTEVIIPNKLTQADMAAIADGDFAITVKAEAIQSDALNATTAEAAFEEVNWGPGTEYGG